MFGENEFFDFKTSGFYYGIYFGVTIGMNVMILNLLVCIISNVFERVQSTEKSEDIKARIEMLTEVEVLAHFLCYYRAEAEPMYLHKITYSNGGEDEQNDVWEGKMRQITNKCDNIVETLRYHKELSNKVNKQLISANANIE